MSRLVPTRMACETGMEQETLYLRVLETVTGYSLTESGELLLDYDSGTAYDEQLIFIPETHLVDTIWVLTAYGDPNDPIVIQAWCDHYSGVLGKWHLEWVILDAMITWPITRSRATRSRLV